jgi:hypothetical protein
VLSDEQLCTRIETELPKVIGDAIPDHLDSEGSEDVVSLDSFCSSPGQDDSEDIDSSESYITTQREDESDSECHPESTLPQGTPKRRSAKLKLVESLNSCAC